ncbi:MAG: YbaK/EbsC family protein [Balneolaceae bacterium]
MNLPHKSSVQRVLDALDAARIEYELRTTNQTAKTAAEAAAALGCTVSEIAKSLIFKRKDTGEPLLLIMSGTNRVHIQKVEQQIGCSITRPDADYVRKTTGFAIGGVPPVGFEKPIETLFDKDLLEYKALWAAAGTHYDVFRAAPADIARITNSTVGHFSE